MAIIYQISLHGQAYDARGKDWSTVENETGCVRNIQWRDPILDRPLLVTEFGCAVSHLRVWQKIAASNRNGIILEEDAVYDSIDPSAVDTLLKEHDSVWLGYRLNTLGYWYNCHAYAIRPETAKRLIEGYKDAIIPVDEWVPAKLKVQSNFFFTPEVVKQIPREVRPSTIEGESMQTHVLTVATDEIKMWPLSKSAERLGYDIINIGKDVDWGGGTMEGQGGGHKINLVRNYISELSDDDIVLFVDGYDVVLINQLEAVVERFVGFNCDILFAAELECWPDPSIAWKLPYQTDGHSYRFLNSGCYIGRVKPLKKFFKEDLDEAQDDQLWCQLRLIEDTEINVVLDSEAYVFQCSDTVTLHKGEIFNENCCPAIYHGNGGIECKASFFNIVSELGYNAPEGFDSDIIEAMNTPLPASVQNKGVDNFLGFSNVSDRTFGFDAGFDKQPRYSRPVPSSHMDGGKELQKNINDIEEALVLPPAYHKGLEYEEIASDILMTDFMSEDQCKRYIEASESLDRWGELDGDKFPAQEIRLKEIGLWDEISEQWADKLSKICEKHWHPEAYLGLRDAFTMRYSIDTQTELGLHTDASLFTGSVKLNDNYAGAELVFPRQEFTNKDVKVGQCILFPSMVTHGHKVLPLRGGKKYSLTMWTCRYEGDSN